MQIDKIQQKRDPANVPRVQAGKQNEGLLTRPYRPRIVIIAVSPALLHCNLHYVHDLHWHCSVQCAHTLSPLLMAISASQPRWDSRRRAGRA